MAGLRLLVGLGNPGADYARTRHNAGFWWVDTIADAATARWGFESKLQSETAKVDIGGQLLLAKPSTFMNKSGIAVASLLRYYRIEPEQMLVAHDDLDLPPGTVRLKFDGGHGGQNGMRDLIEHLGHGRFHRLRIGIGHPGAKDRVLSWVLGRPSISDEAAIRAGIDRACDVLPQVVSGAFDKAMSALHTATQT